MVSVTKLSAFRMLHLPEIALLSLNTHTRGDGMGGLFSDSAKIVLVF